MSPLPSDQHPALTRHGLDFVGLFGGRTERVVLGALQAAKSESVFVLLLRALNGLAELSPPLRMAQLGSDVLKGGLPEDAAFSLCLGVDEFEDGADAQALLALSRDLADAFVTRVDEIPQLAGTLAGVLCAEIDADALALGRFSTRWTV